MVNLQRGEIEARLGGRTYVLCLTLGALAELEAAFGETDMVSLAERFETGRLKSRDVILILGAGLRGAGADISDEEVAQMKCENGLKGCVDVVASLLRATFGGGGEA